MKCQDCGSNEAFVHLSEIVDGNVRSLWLCSRCSLERQNRVEDPILADSLPQKESDSLASFLGEDFLQPKSSTSELPVTVCPSCDYALDRWRKTNLLGCPQCYQAFSSALIPHLTRFHGHASHFGKSPLHRVSDGDQLAAIKRVRIILEKAVSREDFEEAARQRDLLRELKSGKGEES